MAEFLLTNDFFCSKRAWTLKTSHLFSRNWEYFLFCSNYNQYYFIMKHHFIHSNCCCGSLTCVEQKLQTVKTQPEAKFLFQCRYFKCRSFISTTLTLVKHFKIRTGVINRLQDYTYFKFLALWYFKIEWFSFVIKKHKYYFRLSLIYSSLKPSKVKESIAVLKLNKKLSRFFNS